MVRRLVSVSYQCGTCGQLHDDRRAASSCELRHKVARISDEAVANILRQVREGMKLDR